MPKLHEVAPGVWVTSCKPIYPGAGGRVPSALATPPTDTVGFTKPAAATVMAGLPLQLNSTKRFVLPWTTEVGLGVRAPGVAHVVVKTVATVVGTEGKWWVNRVVTAAAVPITETSKSATTHFVESLLGKCTKFSPSALFP